MTIEIGLVLFILVASLVLFVTEWLAPDVIALMVLSVLALTGLVTPVQALSGFSNAAVVTVWAMFILSAALTRSGVAALIGARVLSWVGSGETRMIAVIMITAGVLSAVMNNIGVAVLMLPVIIHVARRTGTPPSKLLMPLAYGSLLGGLTTLVGTPPNLLVSQALEEARLKPFGMFDFTPVGGAVMLGGVAFMALVGRRILPSRDPAREVARGPVDLERQYGLEERSAVVRLPYDSPLAGRTLLDCRLGSATGLNVFAILRDGETHLTPGPDTVLEARDLLLVGGALDRFTEMRGWRQLIVEEDTGLDALVSSEIGVVELHVAPDSVVAGKTLQEVSFRSRFGAIVLALRRGSEVVHRNLATMRLQAGDALLVQGRRPDLEALVADAFEHSAPVDQRRLSEVYRLGERLFTVRVPTGSRLEGKGLAESRIGDALGLGVFGLRRADATHLLPGPDEQLQGDDCLLVRGLRDDLTVFRGLQGLIIEKETPDLQKLEAGRAGLAEAMLSPRTTLAGKTLGELRFREKFGLQVLAILREGSQLDADLRDIRLRWGDALLLLGSRDRLKLLEQDDDFLVLTRDFDAAIETRRAPAAVLIMLAVLAPVIAGVLPISIAAVAGAVLMVLVGCLSMEEAYGSIEWRSIFLIAGMLPLGTALESTGAASWLTEGLLSGVGSLGPQGVLVSLYVVTALATTIIPTAALIVLMAPIALKACAEMGMSEHAVMMAVAMAASASFTSPISHPANLLVMGPGGYRFVDYIKLGLPLAIVVLVITMLVLPLFWPLMAQ